MPRYNVDFDLIIPCFMEVEADDEEAAIAKVAEMSPHEALKQTNHETVFIDSDSIDISSEEPEEQDPTP